MCISVFVASLSWWIFALKFCNMTMKACLKIRVVPTGDVRFKCCLNKSKSEHWTPPDFETLIYQIQFSDLKAGGWQDITTQDRPLSLLLRLPHLSSCFYVCRSPKAEETCIYMDHHGSSTDQLNIDPTTHVFELGTSNPTKIWIYQYIMSVLRNMIQCLKNVWTSSVMGWAPNHFRILISCPAWVDDLPSENRWFPLKEARSLMEPHRLSGPCGWWI